MSRIPHELNGNDTVLCAGTVPNIPFVERVEAAAKAGFSAITIFPSDYRNAIDREGLSERGMASLLADHGLCIAELDPLLDWIPALRADDAAPNPWGGNEQDFYEIANALGARSLNVALASEAGLPLDTIVSAFADVCDRAATHDLLVHLEFLPWSQIANLETAFEVVTLANRNNGGIMLDTWHHYRSGSANSTISDAASRIYALQISDAPEQAADDMITETLAHRLLPGEGDIDLQDILGRLKVESCQAPVGVEVFSTELQKIPAADIAQRAADCIRSVQ